MMLSLCHCWWHNLRTEQSPSLKQIYHQIGLWLPLLRWITTNHRKELGTSTDSTFWVNICWKRMRSVSPIHSSACKPRFHAHELGPDPDLVDTPATSLVRHGAVLGMKSLTNHKSQSHNKLLRDQRFFPWKPARHISNSSSFPWTLISHQVYSTGTCSYQTYSWCHWPGLKRTQHVGNRVDKEVVRG